MTVRPPYLRAGALAKLFSLSERTIRRRIADGTFPSVKLGGARLVPVTLLEDRLEAPFRCDLPTSGEEKSDQ